jgi:hypothetical protein
MKKAKAAEVGDDEIGVSPSPTDIDSDGLGFAILGDEF